MQHHDIENEEEKPLDPEMEKVRRKMIRLLGISLGVMFVGVMAVLVAVVYKIKENSEDQVEASAQASASQTIRPAGAFVEKLEVILPLGFDIRSVDLDGALAAIYGVTTENQSRLFLVDLSSGEILSDIVLRH